ncbi:hypothetical protein evm_012357 [Chilo suppressalis]|nr:hypothetical protein evm_012357 [Chilo suppressalis]
MECNPREFSHCTAITARSRRGETYKTNFTFTMKNPWNNNVSTSMTFKNNGTMAPYKLQNRICELLNKKWVAEFLLVFTDIKPKCPILAGTYHFVNIELPPKNFPLPIPDGKTLITQTFYATETNEMLSRTKLTLIAT